MATKEERLIDRVERQLSEYKASHAAPTHDSGKPEGPMDRIVRGLLDDSFESGLTEAGKLRVLEGEVEWRGVSVEDKRAVLLREVDFSKITPEQFEFVYHDIEFEKGAAVDRTVAAQLYWQALAAEQQADYHAARVRDYGEADAATYEQRVLEGAKSMPSPTGPSPETWPSEIAKAHRQQQQERSAADGASVERQTEYGADEGHSM